MTTFKIYIDGQYDEVKAKHIAEGNYYVKRIKTGNRFQIKWICTYRSDATDELYGIAQFYPGTHYSEHYPDYSKIHVVKKSC